MLEMARLLDMGYRITYLRIYQLFELPIMDSGTNRI
jgi:hypothetical protein